MIDITTLTPLVIATGLGFCFKNTRAISICCIALMGFIYPVLFLTLGSIGILAYVYYYFSK